MLKEKVINLKSKVIVINNIKIIKILFIAVIFFVCLVIINIVNNKDNKAIQNNNLEEKEIEVVTKHCDDINNNVNNVISRSNNASENKVDFPKEIGGYKVIGKIEIPKIDLTTYILSETNKESLDKSVTKLCGPKINGIGNLCITGHNYNKENMFSNLKKLEIGDSIFVTDTTGNKIEYLVYDKYKVYPKETECLSQNTEGEREVTLITCTGGAIKRLIIKAREVYD